MATKSMLKTVEIKDKNLASKFAEALEKAVNAPEISTDKSDYRECEDLPKDKIKDFLCY